MMKHKKNVILFLGYGYCASYLSDAFVKDGHSFLVLSTRSRNAKKLSIAEFIKYKISNDLFRNSQQLSVNLIEKSLSSFDIPIYQDSLEHPSYHLNYYDFVKQKLSDVTHIIITAPPKGKQDPAFTLYKELFTRHYCPHLKWLGYLSATSVYGNLNGEKCDENSLVQPCSLRGENRARAEKLWLSLHDRYQIPVHIFRLTGIYGPHRNNIQNVIDGRIVSIVKDNHLGNRIYIKDIVRALQASMNAPMAGHIFNLSDDLPASSAAVNEYIAFLTDSAIPPVKHFDEVKDTISFMRRSFFEESKIVDNQKIKKMLDFSFAYPTYRDGLSDILDLQKTIN